MCFDLYQSSSDVSLRGLWHLRWSTIPSFGKDVFKELLMWTWQIWIVPSRPQHCNGGKILHGDCGPLVLAVGEGRLI